MKGSRLQWVVNFAGVTVARVLLPKSAGAWVNRLYAFRLATLAGVIAAVAGAVAHAETRLAKSFGNNMVIQRGLPAHVWGECGSNGSVQVSLGPRHATAKAHADGTWEVILDEIPVVGPYTLSVES